MDELVITQGDDQRLFDIPTGQAFTVHLSESPTTGFRWQFNIPDGLTSIDNDYVAAPGAAIGGGGTRIIRVRADTPGTYRIIVKLLRPWIGEGSTRQQCEFTILVH